MDVRYATSIRDLEPGMVVAEGIVLDTIPSANLFETVAGTFEFDSEVAVLAVIEPSMLDTVQLAVTLKRVHSR
jgi:hypothetical protein